MSASLLRAEWGGPGHLCDWPDDLLEVLDVDTTEVDGVAGTGASGLHCSSSWAGSKSVGMVESSGEDSTISINRHCAVSPTGGAFTLVVALQVGLTYGREI